MLHLHLNNFVCTIFVFSKIANFKYRPADSPLVHLESLKSLWHGGLFHYYFIRKVSDIRVMNSHGGPPVDPMNTVLMGGREDTMSRTSALLWWGSKISWEWWYWAEAPYMHGETEQGIEGAIEEPATDTSWRITENGLNRPISLHVYDQDLWKLKNTPLFSCHLK